jgi:hypothetical protein
MGTRGIKALAAAASLAVLTMASQAMASQEIKISDVEMDRKFEATIDSIPGYTGPVAVYSNGVNFTATFVTGGALGAAGSNVPDLFGFCIDVFHEIGLGTQTLYYDDNKGDPGALATDNGGHNLVAPVPQELTNLINLGYNIHENEVAAGVFDNTSEMQIAAIQAAIWAIEVPSVTVKVISANLGTTGPDSEFDQYQAYFNSYVDGTYSLPTALSNDKVYTITSRQGTQNFAIGWPIAVPEPSTWAMMLLGFGGMGAVVRRQRKAAAVAA